MPLSNDFLRNFFSLSVFSKKIFLNCLDSRFPGLATVKKLGRVKNYVFGPNFWTLKISLLPRPKVSLGENNECKTFPGIMGCLQQSLCLPLKINIFKNLKK